MSEMWVRLDDGVTSHPKILALIERVGKGAFFDWVDLLTWASRHRTEGHFTDAVARKQGVTRRVLNAMIEVRLVERNGDGYALHDFGDYAGRKDRTAAERMRRYRGRNDA